jgi:hypothetical protein
MPLRAVLAPVFVLVALTFVLLFWMGAARVRALRRGKVRMCDIALGQPAWPKRETRVANAFHNQLELPVLFYVLVGLAIIVDKTDLLFLATAWLFVTLRIVHAAIHAGSNAVPRRFFAFLGGALVLLVMWFVFAVRVLAGLS